MKYTDLTEEQQDTFKKILEQYDGEIPSRATHFDVQDISDSGFLVHLEDDTWEIAWSNGCYSPWSPDECELYYVFPIPEQPWYDPENVSFKSGENCHKEVRDSKGSEFVDDKADSLSKQEGGSHYKGCKIQPVEYIVANELGYMEGNVVKYVSRHKDKNGAEDIKKAIHYLEMILDMQYGDC